MSNKLLFTGILCFVCGILFGYATSIWTINNYDGDNKRGRRKRFIRHDDIDETDDDMKSFRNEFEKEFNRLYEKLNSIEQKLSDNNVKIKQMNTSDESTESDEFQDIQTDQFYDTAEIIKDEIDDNINGDKSIDYQRIDELFESDSPDVQYIYDYLKENYTNHNDETELLWRLSKAAHLLSKTNEYINDEESRKKLLYESFEMAEKALKLNDKDANCHKWYAISIGCLKDFVSMREKVQNGIKFKNHLDIALSLKDDDPTLYYLAGRFCLEILTLSWAERKLGSMLIGESLPTITNEDALQYFLKAYHLKPRWKENLFHLVQILLQLNEEEKAEEYLQEALNIPLNEHSGDEKMMHDKLMELKMSKFS